MSNEEHRPKITHVAIRFKGVVYSLPAPNRHHDVIRYIIETTEHKKVDAHNDEDCQGFLDESGAFLRRKPALLSAKANNQIKPGVTPSNHNGLFSEDIW